MALKSQLISSPVLFKLTDENIVVLYVTTTALKP